MIDCIGMLRELFIFLLISVPAVMLLCSVLHAMIGTICEALEIENRTDKNGIRILPLRKPSPESVAERHNALARISTPRERKIVEAAKKINEKHNG